MGTVSLGIFKHIFMLSLINCLFLLLLPLLTSFLDGLLIIHFVAYIGSGILKIKVFRVWNDDVVTIIISIRLLSWLTLRLSVEPVCVVNHIPIICF